MATRGPTPRLGGCLLAASLLVACPTVSCTRPAGVQDPIASQSPADQASLEKEPACPSFGPARTLGTANAPALDEVSGLAASRRHPVLWTHNDSGDSPRLFALDLQARLVATVDLANAEALDWEDIALAPGPEQTDTLYVADFGDNEEKRPFVTIYGLDEPTRLVTSSRRSARLRLELRYPEGPRNAESLLVHPESHDLFIVTKHPLGVSRIYVKRAPHEGGAFELQKLGEIQFGIGDLSGIPLTTAADFSPDGRLLTIRTYDDVFVWSVPTGASVMEVLRAAPCATVPIEQPQGESITFAADGSGLLTLSERRNQPLLFLPASPPS